MRQVLLWDPSTVDVQRMGGISYFFMILNATEYVLLSSSSFNVYCRALGLPTTDLTYDDCKLMIRGRQMNLPHHDDIVEIEKLRQEIGYDENNEMPLNSIEY